MARPRRFDEELLLQCALDAFWRSGFDRASIDEISSAAGVGNGSIYAAYGSKLGLFLAVFSRYCEGRVDLVRRSLENSEGASFDRAVAQYLDDVVSDCTSHDDRRGCLMLTSLADLADRFPEVVHLGRASIRRMEELMADRVREAAQKGQVDVASEDVEALAAQIVLVSQGLIQLSRIGVDPERLRQIAAITTRSVTTRAA